tara:strand:- start:3980 stop:4627 length:648 start_codon:yes stop_codon:yes gene_type:complete
MTQQDDSGQIEDSFDWGAQLESFPSSQVEEWNFHVTSSDEEGESAVLQGRCDPELARRIDEIILLAKGVGIPFKTRSDYVRFACMKVLGELVQHVKMDDPSMKHYLVSERHAQQAALHTAQADRVSKTVAELCKGLVVLTRGNLADLDYARDRINDFLTPIMGMAGENDHLMSMYIRETFKAKQFQRAIDKIEEKMKLGSVIENARRAYENVNSE